MWLSLSFYTSLSSLQLLYDYELSMHHENMSTINAVRFGSWFRRGCRYLTGSYMLKLAAVTGVQNIAGKEGSQVCISSKVFTVKMERHISA